MNTPHVKMTAVTLTVNGYKQTAFVKLPVQNGKVRMSDELERDLLKDFGHKIGDLYGRPSKVFFLAG